MNQKALLHNWSWVKLGDVCKTTSGGTPSRKIKRYYNGDIPWLKSGELKNNTIYEADEKITTEAIENSSTKIFPQGTLLIALYGATVGRLAFLGMDAATNQAVAAIFPPKDLSNKYLYWYLFNYRKKLLKQRIGGAQPNISQGTLKSIPIPLPPLPEQHRIVEKIEELFSELDNGIENLKKAKEQIKTYRQAVLKSAFEGKLVQGQRTKDKGKREDRELPEGWELVDLGEVCEKVSSAKNLDPNSEFLYLDIGGIDNKINEIVTHKKYNWRDAPSRAKQIVLGGDILFSTVRTYLKNIALVPQRYSGQIASTGFCVIRPRKNILLSEYIFHLTLYEKFLEPLNALQTGSSYPAVRDKNVFSQKIPLPPLTQQTQIVEEIEKRFSVADKMEAAIDESLQKAEALRQSILKQAFEGKLV